MQQKKKSLFLKNKNMPNPQALVGGVRSKDAVSRATTSSTLPMLIGMLEKLSIVTTENDTHISDRRVDAIVEKSPKAKQGWGWRDNFKRGSKK